MRNANGICGGAVVAIPALHDQLPQLQDYMTPTVYHRAMGAVIVGNILLRFKTDRALDQK